LDNSPLSEIETDECAKDTVESLSFDQLDCTSSDDKIKYLFFIACYVAKTLKRESKYELCRHKFYVRKDMPDFEIEESK